MIENKENKKVMWMVWDAASMNIVEKLLAEGRLPNLKRVMEKGIGLRLRLNQPNCQTPAALATLFTGMPSEKNGISGFYTPDINNGESLLSRKSSFHQKELHRYSIWNWAASNGRTVSLAHVPFVGELEESERNAYGIAVDGYRRRVARGKVFAASSMRWTKNEACNSADAVLEIDGFCFKIRLYRLNSKQRVTVVYQKGLERQAVDMEIGEETINEKHCLSLGVGIMLSVSALYKPGDMNEVLLIFSGVYQVEEHKGEDISGMLGYTGAFEGEGYGRYYRKGVFGKTIAKGGQGEAEAIFMKLLNRTAMYFERVGEYCIRNYPADLTVFYQPCIDEMSHEFIGFCDRNCELYDDKYYHLYWNCVDEAYQMADRHLGALIRLLPEDADVVVTSDHGMAAVSRVIYINELLRRNGILEFDSSGAIDISKSKAFFHPADNGSIFVNTDDYKGGIVPQSMKQEIVEDLIGILEGAKDPDTAKPIIKRIRKVYEMGEVPRTLFGDLFIEPSYSYCLKGDASDSFIEETNKSGCHHYNADFSSMDGIFFTSNNICGYHETICNTEVFEVVCSLMGIPSSH